MLAARPTGDAAGVRLRVARGRADAEPGRRRGARPERLRLGRSVHAQPHDRHSHVRRPVRARRRDRRRCGRPGRRVAPRRLRAEGDWVLSRLGWREQRRRRRRLAPQARSRARPAVGGARRARHAGAHGVGRPDDDRRGEGGRDDLRLGRGRRRRQRRRADREAEGPARDRERRLRPRRSSGCGRSGSRRSTTARRRRGMRSPTGSTCTSTTSAARSSRRRSARCGRSAA